MAGQGSARVTLREIDLSQVSSSALLPQGVPAGVVGPAKKGPAFVPRTFANMRQFADIFGDMLEVSRESNSNNFGPLALNEWMKSANAGSYIRILGVGNGEKRSTDTTPLTDAGFVVGSKQVQSDGSVGVSPYSSEPGNLITDHGKTHMLGCFMKDAAGSRFLTDAGMQAAPSAGSSLDNAFVFATPVNGDTVTMFLPKEVVNADATTKVSSDVTLKFVAVSGLSVNHADIADDTIEILIDDGGIDNDTNDNLQAALAADIDAGVNSGGATAYKFNNLSLNPSEIFTVIDGTSGAASSKITLSIAKEGAEATIEQTSGAGATMRAAGKVNFSDEAVAVPVVRGVLFAPYGVKPSLDVSAALDADFNLLSEADSDNPVTRTVKAQFGDTVADDNFGYPIGEVSDAGSFTIILNGYNRTGYANSYECSFDPAKPNYFAKVLNTDPAKTEELGHCLYAHWDVYSDVAEISLNGLARAGNPITAAANVNYQKMKAFLVKGEDIAAAPNHNDYRDRFQTAESPWLVSQTYSKAQDDRASMSTADVYKLFKLHALDDGEIGHNQFRVLISGLSYIDDSTYGSFDLTLEPVDSDPIKGDVLYTWKKLTFDPESRNYIARVIGNQREYYDFDRATAKQRLVVEGVYPVKNPYVRVELSDDLLNDQIPVDALPMGFAEMRTLKTAAAGAFVEPFTGTGESAIFANAANTNHQYLQDMKVPPVPMVRSIARKITTTRKEASSDLAWGIKFSTKSKADDDFKELTELALDRSNESFRKYFPKVISGSSTVAAYSTEDLNNSFFSLEKISVKESSGEVDWSESVYSRDGSLVDDHARFLVASTDIKVRNQRYLKFRFFMQGGFDGLNVLDREKYAMSNTAALREGADEDGDSVFTGPTIMSYRRGIDVYTDKSAAEIQILATPGIREPKVTDYAVTAAEDRFDALYIMDIEERNNAGTAIVDASDKPHVLNTVNHFAARRLDTSFAAAYFPDVIMEKPSNRALMKVPPSVAVLGAISRNDALADPWFAPAGLNRGRLQAATDTTVIMNRDLLDEVYDADINPIYVPAGREGEVYIFGQKTLLQDQSALDRINVRRLLINLRRRVKRVAERLLFEPNRSETLARFNALVEPIMQEVQQRQGVDRYKVKIDSSTTTQNDVENNTIRGKIYLQPTKSVEFISLDFVVSNSINQ